MYSVSPFLVDLFSRTLQYVIKSSLHRGKNNRWQKGLQSKCISSVICTHSWCSTHDVIDIWGLQNEARETRVSDGIQKALIKSIQNQRHVQSQNVCCWACNLLQAHAEFSLGRTAPLSQTIASKVAYALFCVRSFRLRFVSATHEIINFARFPYYADLLRI